MRMVFENSKEQELNDILEYVSDTNWLKRVRIIPFSSIGKENGILIGLRPDYIEVGENNEKRRGQDVIIGICNKALSKEQEYRAILSPELV
jgi:stage II sporulation protein GA (sporulation sigma-E factor processing peptidase)